MAQKGLLPKGFNKTAISNSLKNADLDREHWLIAYESVRHGFLAACAPAVKSNGLFCELLKNKVTFYRKSLPAYAPLVHYGGAPGWIVREWLTLLKKEEAAGETTSTRTALVELLGKDVAKIGRPTTTAEATTIELMEAVLEASEAEATEAY